MPLSQFHNKHIRKLVLMTIDLFFALIRDALWDSTEDIPLELPKQETGILFSIAEQQSVCGLVIEALIHNNIKMSQQWVFKAISLLEQIKQQNKIINEGVVKLDRLMNEAGINYTIVKGQVLASYYPNSLLRQPGDIDYYCGNSVFDRALKVIKEQWGVTPERDGAEKHYHFNYNGVTFEGHFKLVELYGRKRNECFKDLVDCDISTEVDIDGHPIKTLSPTIHVLYVFLHLYNHLLKLGIGLRQFCDLAVMLHCCKGQINIDVMNEYLHALGMEKAYRACGCILVDYIGLKEVELGYTLTNTDRRYGKRVLNVVMFRGNMGHYNKLSGFNGWMHKVETTGIKLSHFVKFVLLAPGYSCGWLWHEFRRNL